jgi:predicted DNA-binding protein with PD1-like motif
MRSLLFVLAMASTALAQQAPGLHATELKPVQRRFEIVFNKDDEVVAGLAEFAEKNQIKLADFSALGTLGKAVLGWYDPAKKAFRKFSVDEEMEIASLTGNIRPDRNGKPVVHVHCVVATSDGLTHAGHLVEGHVSLTVQLYMNVNETLPASASK